jgi:hypothetical protein
MGVINKKKEVRKQNEQVKGIKEVSKQTKDNDARKRERN